MSRRWLALGLVSIAFATITGLAPVQAQAQGTGLTIQCDTSTTVNGVVQLSNRCTIEHFLEQFVILVQYGMRVVVFLAVLTVIYGGFQFLTAGGRSEKVKEGKNIITGTVIGLIVSLSAYVIINFAVTAITGTSVASINPFAGRVGTVFNNDKDLTRPFSGVLHGDNVAKCNAKWDSSCADQVFCADQGTKGGPVHDIQRKMNSFGCSCGSVDGCFGLNTLDCVRRFQIANDLTPTGIYDEATQDTADRPGPIFATRCDDATAAAKINEVYRQFSQPTLTSAAEHSKETTGCCVVLKEHDATSDPLYCADTTTERGCLALNPDNIFVPGQQCATSDVTNLLCGFCSNTTSTALQNNPDSTDRCFQYVTKHWCENVARRESLPEQDLVWRTGSGTNHPYCSGGTPTRGLLRSLP